MRRATVLDPAQGSLFENDPERSPSGSRPGRDADAEASGPRGSRPLPRTTPLAPLPDARPSVPPPRPVAGESLQDVLAPAVFRHPQADREIRLCRHIVGYALRRARRRSIGFVVSLEGLTVKAPRWTALREIEAALRAKGEWILQKLGEQQERSRRLEASRIAWGDGATVPFLGEDVIVVLDPRASAGGAVLDSAAGTLPGVPRLTLHVGLGAAASPAQIRDVVQSWLQRQARRIFEERCAHFAARLGVRYTRLALSSAQTRWGSANATGAIRLNWRLVHFTLSTIDYVVAHELAHLREMNHSPRFWQVVRSVLPEYESARGTLRSSALPLFD